MEEKGRTASGAGLEHQLEELQRRATQDALSGLLNRETLELVVKDRLRSLGPEDTCALFIVDLDDFKRVNDTLGHQAGDQAIRQAGQILSNLFYARDIVGRLGATSSRCSSTGTSPWTWSGPRPPRSAGSCSWSWARSRP